MFLRIENLLEPGEVKRLREIAANTRFVDGRATNPASTVKNNTQADTAEPGAQEASRLIMQAFGRSPEFTNFCFAELVAPPLLTKYAPGMTYGEHIDAAEIQVGRQRIRTDLSCTVFLNDPEAYEGGELDIRLQGHHLAIKGRPGEAVVYPSTTFHRVREVTKGERLVAITFIQSRVRDGVEREILFELGEFYAFEAENVSWENRQRLEFVLQNLKRRWLDR
ncbi:Fe2+-dependent dioxygenase [Marinicauda algicola]|uniref:Fe2+-dependent dioxygenase n=1 Tax=Marinicauda algicola TaxID=2029849 RepID=A0A4S2H026_9PROT|nr:Fe2+-dependent dioxygenase [Marinicauda algicola]TGY88890.1 Fe2+-dependent dioxygenase [Marinicauda algicola]